MWGNRTLLRLAKSIEKKIFSIEKKQILTQSVEKSVLIDPLTTNNAMYRDLLTFSFLLA